MVTPVTGTSRERVTESIEPLHSTTVLLLITAVAVATLLFSIMKVKLHAFIALVLVSLVTAVAAGIRWQPCRSTLS